MILIWILTVLDRSSCDIFKEGNPWKIIIFKKKGQINIP